MLLESIFLPTYSLSPFDLAQSRSLSRNALLGVARNVGQSWRHSLSALPSACWCVWGKSTARHGMMIYWSPLRIPSAQRQICRMSFPPLQPRFAQLLHCLLVPESGIVQFAQCLEETSEGWRKNSFTTGLELQVWKELSDCDLAAKNFIHTLRLVRFDLTFTVQGWGDVASLDSKCE